MGKITDHLLSLIKKQIKDFGIVVWYDPDKSYARFVQTLDLPGVDILIHDTGFFELREKIEPYLEFVLEDGTLKPDADQPPSLLIYLPMAREETGYALIEAETAGTVLEPGAPHGDCNTRLGRLVEQVFGQVAPLKAAHLARQADEGLLTLEELDRQAEEAGSVAAGILQVIFGQVSVEEMLLKYLDSDVFDQPIIEKKALDDLRELIGTELGMEGLPDDSPSALRNGVRKSLLSADLISPIPEDELPEPWRYVALPEKDSQKEMGRHLCRLWRNRLDFKNSYIEAAEAVEKTSGLAGWRGPLTSLREGETFPFSDRHWLDQAGDLITQGKAQEALDLIGLRLPLFWPREKPALHLEWMVLKAAAELGLEAGRIQGELKKSKWSLDDLIQAYASFAAPWMRLDRLARHLETRYTRLDTLDSGAEHLEKVLVEARRQYAEVLHQMALAYAKAAAEGEFESRRFKRQSQIFKETVTPLLAEGRKIAFFLVDALRFEMGSELLEGLGEDYQGHIEPVLGQLPGITVMGMAALLPKAEQGLALAKTAGGLTAVLANKSLGSRQARLAWIQEQSGVPMASYRLGEVVKLTPKRKKEIAAVQLVVVTSQEIDRFAEEAGDEEEARRYMDGVLEKLRQGIRSLARAGFENFVLSADHGFQLLETLDPGLSMDPPGGETAEIHPRVWIGQGGAQAEGFLRVKASDLELGGELEFAFPLGLGTFKVKGGVSSYLHGGLSLQEQVLPLLTIQVQPKKTPGAFGLKIKLSMAKSRITNRLFTVTVEAQAEGLFPEAERRVRLELRSGKEEIGAAVAAAYGFEEGARELTVKPGQPNVVTLMIQAPDPPKTVTIQVVDCENQIVLDVMKDIPVELTL